MLDKLVNKILKSNMKHPPSSDAEFIGFFTAYSILFLSLRQRNTYRNKVGRASIKVLIGMVVVVLVVVCSSSYHTLLQTVVGMLVGISLGSLMFFVVVRFIAPHFPTIVSWSISEFLLIRDMQAIPNVLFFEYLITIQEVRARQRQAQRATRRGRVQ